MSNIDSNTLALPIPKWVRFYAFGVLIILMIALVAFSFFFKIERVAVVEVLFSDGRSSIQCSLTEFEVLKGRDTLEISFSSKASENVILRCDQAKIKDDNIIVPLNVLGSEQTFRKALPLQGRIVVQHSTIMSSVFKRIRL